MKVSKVHCLFEQSGTFKNEFRKFDKEAYDYDIKNDFGQTDYVLDIFTQIDEEINGVNSYLFGSLIMPEDLILAFFPCTYFCNFNDMFFSGTAYNYKNLKNKDKILKIIERSEQRQYYYKKVLELIYVCESRGYRLIIENPYSGQHYWRNNFPGYTKIVDRDRTRRGDVFRKPTQYIFVGCEPAMCKVSCSKSDKVMTIHGTKRTRKEGMYSIERSIMTSTYAHNFICDFILDIPSGMNIDTLFNDN